MTISQESIKYYQDMAKDVDYSEDFVDPVSDYGKLALGILREKNPLWYCELGLTSELEDWVKNQDEIMSTREMELYDEFSTKVKSQLVEDGTDYISGNFHAMQQAKKVCRQELYGNVPTYSEVRENNDDSQSF